MQRNNELVRELLLFIEINKESYHDGFNSEQISIEAYDKHEIAYHCMLILDAGFLIGKNSSSQTNIRVSIHGLSWHGHEFLDSVRDEEFWGKIKSKAEEENIPLNTHFIAAISKSLVAKALA